MRKPPVKDELHSVINRVDFPITNFSTVNQPLVSYAFLCAYNTIITDFL